MSTPQESSFQDRSSDMTSRSEVDTRSESKHPEPRVEITAAFRQYCENRQQPNLTPVSVGYICDCATNAVQKAQFLGQEVAIVHHSMFVQLVVECGHPELL